MRYVSTRGEAPACSFEEAMLAGLAPDGGLYVPAEFPTFGADAFAGLAGRSYEEAVRTVVRPFLGETFSEVELGDMVARAYAGFAHAARAPLVQLDSGLFLLELFHGPTLAFKDFAMQLVAEMFETVLSRRGERVTILGATSGDTGSAAIEAFRGSARADVFILYPEGRVSDVQRRQMTTVADANVHAVAVDGDFDACQALVKEAFADAAFRDEVGLAAVNSINWARVLAQVVYYVTAAISLGAPHRAVSFTVPTGNFGDVLAGDVARRMGLGVERLVVATNANDILHRALACGDYTTAGVTPTSSPSMDIQVSSNFERALFEALGRDASEVARRMAAMKREGGFRLAPDERAELAARFASGRASEAETAETIRATRAATGQTICPHTAVGVKVAGEHAGATPMVSLATAHPAKFPNAVAAATGMRPPLPPHLADLLDRPERCARVAAEAGAVKSAIREARTT